MKINLTFVDGTRHEMQIEVTITVNALIERISGWLSVDPSNVRLILRGVVLSDLEQRIDSLQVKPSDIVICNVLCPQPTLPDAPREEEEAEPEEVRDIGLSIEEAEDDGLAGAPPTEISEDDGQVHPSPASNAAPIETPV
jgi:hypothetical protein